ncbi:MAG: hypothetical protein WC389_10975 [Lutibacter sp.]|jgi:hypothetical protein
MTQKEIIKALKENTSAFGLMPKELQEAARKIAGDNFEVYDGTLWYIAFDVAFNVPYKAYRLRPDYQPKPEYEKFEIVPDGVYLRMFMRKGQIETFIPINNMMERVDFAHFETELENKHIPIEDIATYIHNGGKVFVVLRKE